MTSKYRTATQTRRGARSGFPEHDDFEGLPVRQWRQEWVNVASTPPTESSQQNDIWDRELFYGMPKDAPLLAPHSQELLRAARSGRLYKRPAPTDDDDVDNDGLDTKGDKKDSDPSVEGFMVRTWKQIPKNAEGATVSHLAKRHKNTVTLPPKAVLVQISGPTATRHKVRRIDAAGNPYEQTVTVAEGQKVDGEIISTTIVPLHSANPELAPQPQATPARRRPPPPKRKAKGPGRGRKKGRLPLAAAPAPVQQPVAEGGAPPMKNENTGSDEQGVKIEDNEDSANQDSEMADNSALPSDDEDGEDGDDGEEEGGDEEGDETPEIETIVERTQDQDHEMEDSEVSEVIRPSSIEEPEEPRRSTSEEEITLPKARFQPPTGLGNLGGPMHLSSPRLEGSPLKNVIIQSPTDQSPLVSPHAGAAAASSYMEMHTSMSGVVDNAAHAVSGASVPETVSGTFGTASVLDSQAGSGTAAILNPQPEAASQETKTDTAPLLGLPGNSSPSQPHESTALPSAPAAEVTQQTLDIGDIQVPDAPNAMLSEQQQPPETIAPAVEPPSAVPDSTPQPKEATPFTPPIKDEKTDTPVPLDIATKPEAEPLRELGQPEVASEPRPEPPDSPTLQPTAPGADEDEGLNLLGSLERELDRQEGSLSMSGSDASPAVGSGSIKPVEESAETRENTMTAQIPEVELAGSGGAAEVGAELPAAVNPVVVDVVAADAAVSGSGNGDAVMVDAPVPVPAPVLVADPPVVSDDSPAVKQEEESKGGEQQPEAKAQ